MILIKNILVGDYEAQKQFYDKYKLIISDFINCKYPNSINVDDDISEILIKVFTNLYKYDEEKASLKTWILSITKNYMIDKSRSVDLLNGSVTIDTSELGDWIHDLNINSTGTAYINADNVNAHFTSNNCVNDFENCNTINFVSNQMTTNDFTFLDMHYNQGYTYCEIGDEFNITSSTVSNRISYVKSKLKKNIDKEIIY